MFRSLRSFLFIENECFVHLVNFCSLKKNVLFIWVRLGPKNYQKKAFLGGQKWLKKGKKLKREQNVLKLNKTFISVPFKWMFHSLRSFRVGHPVLLRSERTMLLRSFLDCNVLFHSFFEFLATYETQKNDAFFSIHF